MHQGSRTWILLVIGKYDYINGIDAFLSPFVELKSLYLDGIRVNECVIRGALLAFLADNLAAHAVAGFKESH